jgi:hypothetical protein
MSSNTGFGFSSSGSVGATGTANDYKQTPERGGTNNNLTGAKFTHICAMDNYKDKPVVLLRYEDYKKAAGGTQSQPSSTFFLNL